MTLHDGLASRSGLTSLSLSHLHDAASLLLQTSSLGPRALLPPPSCSFPPEYPAAEEVAWRQAVGLHGDDVWPSGSVARPQVIGSCMGKEPERRSPMELLMDLGYRALHKSIVLSSWEDLHSGKPRGP